MDAVKGQLEFLASDWTEGRETGAKGGFLAADYIASLFKVHGIQPAGDYHWTKVSREERWDGVRPEKYRSYFQDFSLIKRKAGEHQKFILKTKNSGSETSLSFNYKTDFSIDNFGTVGKAIESPVVFVGYGYVNEDEGYDDYKGIDVEGKIILRLSGFPGEDDTASEAYKKFHPEGRYARYYLYRAKNQAAKDNGVAAVIEISNNAQIPDSWHKNYPLRYNYPYYEGDERLSTYNYSYSIPDDTLKHSALSLNVSQRVITAIMEKSGIDLEAYKTYVKDKMKPQSKVISGKSIYLKTSVITEYIKARNVIGVIEGKDPEQIIVLGAHYDHLGQRNGYIWNGADDNASGTVGVMTIAKACMEAGVQPEKTLVFAAWTGEEKGLLGSRYFVDHPYSSLEDIVLNLNFDMISRDDKDDTLKNKFGITFSESYPVMKEIGEKNVTDYSLNLDVNYRPSKGGYGGSDHAPFSQKDIPFCFYMSGFHTDYHQPSDHIEKVNWEKLLNIIKLGYLNAWDLSNTEWEESKEEAEQEEQ